MKEPPNFRDVLASLFARSELACLLKTPRFCEALAETKTAFDFERICELAEEILDHEKRAKVSAREFRQNTFQHPDLSRHSRPELDDLPVELVPWPGG